MIVKNSSMILKELRTLMQNSKYVSEPLHAYIILSGDAHLSEYIAERDMRREYVSGFTGSAGVALCKWFTYITVFVRIHRHSRYYA